MSGKDEEDIAGFIFMCNQETKPECYRYRVFGLPFGKKEAVMKVKTGAKLFLYDFDVKLLYGVYEATSSGGLNLEPAAFRGMFPSQVSFRIYKECLPIPEKVFKHAIIDNYNGGSKFRQDLGSSQMNSLIELFRPIDLTSFASSALHYEATHHHAQPAWCRESFQAISRLPPAKVTFLPGMHQTCIRPIRRSQPERHDACMAYEPYVPQTHPVSIKEHQHYVPQVARPYWQKQNFGIPASFPQEPYFPVCDSYRRFESFGNDYYESESSKEREAVPHSLYVADHAYTHQPPAQYTSIAQLAQYQEYSVPTQRAGPGSGSVGGTNFHASSLNAYGITPHLHHVAGHYTVGAQEGAQFWGYAVGQSVVSATSQNVYDAIPLENVIDQSNMHQPPSSYNVVAEGTQYQAYPLSHLLGLPSTCKSEFWFMHLLGLD